MKIFMAVAALFLLWAGSSQGMPPAPVITGKWNLQRWDGYTAQNSQMHPWVSFKAEGDVELWDGCSKYTGRYTQNSTTTIIDHLAKQPAVCAINDPLFDALTKYFAIAIAQQGGMSVHDNQLTFNTMRGDNFYFKSANPAPLPGILSSGAAPRAARREDIRHVPDMSGFHGWSSENSTPLTIVCDVRTDGFLTNCTATGPHAAEQQGDARFLGAKLVIKPGTSGPLIFKFEFQ